MENLTEFFTGLNTLWITLVPVFFATAKWLNTVTADWEHGGTVRKYTKLLIDFLDRWRTAETTTILKAEKHGADTANGADTN